MTIIKIYIQYLYHGRLHCGTLKNPHTIRKRVGHGVPSVEVWPSVPPSYACVSEVGVINCGLLQADFRSHPHQKRILLLTALNCWYMCGI